MSRRAFLLRVYPQKKARMKIAEYVGTNIVILEPHGRLTMETVQFFRRAIARRVEQGWSGIIIDLQHIDYIDSAGLGCLAAAYTSCRRRGSRLVLVRVAGRNRELLRVTRLLTVFDVYETTLEAERGFSRPPDALIM